MKILCTNMINNYISPIQCLFNNIDSRPFHYIPLIKLLSKFLELDRVQILLKEHQKTVFPKESYQMLAIEKNG